LTCGQLKKGALIPWMALLQPQNWKIKLFFHRITVHSFLF
jgi:hypothetical protein